MASTTIDRINQLSAERSRLYALASDGRRGEPEVLSQIADVTRQLDELWERRRRERAGRPDDIDRLVDREYARLYGPLGEESARPASHEGDRLLVAA